MPNFVQIDADIPEKKKLKCSKVLRTTKDDVQIQIAKGLSDLDDEESPDLRPEPLMEGLYF